MSEDFATAGKAMDMAQQKWLILTVGLPRSGKSTWAKSTGWPIVSPDSIRLALHGQAFRNESEPFVWACAYTMARALFLSGHRTVVVDATNITRKHRDAWREYFKDVEVKCLVFRTSAEECINRAKSTGREDIIPVIQRQSQEWDFNDKEEKHFQAKIIRF